MLNHKKPERRRDFSRECLTATVDTSLSGVRVVRELERLGSERATPQVVVSDNGPELVSNAVFAGLVAGSTGTTSSAANRAKRFRRIVQQPLA